MNSSWTRLAAAVTVAAVIAAAAFLIRFNPLGGTLGGFDNDHFVHLVRTDLLLAGEQPLRDFADAELRGARPSLGYAASAWAQQVWGRTLLAEAYLTAGALAVSAAGVFLLAFQISGRWAVSLLAAACLIAAMPKLYNYEKVLVLVVALWLVRRWILKPSWPWLAIVSIWTAVAALIRHDFAVYVGVAAGIALLARGPATLALRLGRVAAYGAITLLLLTPSIVWIQTYEGLARYAQRTQASIRAESQRTELEEWPRVARDEGLSRANLIAVVYYGFWALAIGGIIVVAVVAIRASGVEASLLPTGLALVACAVVANAFFLRGNLLARFGDAIVPSALVAAWMTAAIHAVTTPGGSSRAVNARASAWAAIPVGLLLAIFGATASAGDFVPELRAAGLTQSWEQTRRRVRAAHEGLRQMPPEAWTDELSAWMPAASRYLAECTGPGDRVLLATYAPEVPVFARRLVAAGQGTFGLAFYESEAQQLEAVARLERQSVPVVLGSFDDFEGEFVGDYRHVYEYVAAHYHDAGAIGADGQVKLRVLVRSDRQVRRTDPRFGLPCFT